MSGAKICTLRDYWFTAQVHFPGVESIHGVEIWCNFLQFRRIMFRRISALSCLSKVSLSGRLTQMHEVSEVTHSPRWCTLKYSIVWMPDGSPHSLGGSCLGGLDLLQELLFAARIRNASCKRWHWGYPPQEWKHSCAHTHAHARTRTGAGSCTHMHTHMNKHMHTHTWS